MNILVLCNEDKITDCNIKKGLNFLMDNNNVTWVSKSGLWDSETLIDFNLVIISKSGSKWMNKKIESDFIEYVNSGGSLLAIHTGIVNYSAFISYSNLLGGIHSHNSNICPVSYMPVSNHDLTLGVVSFHYNDQHYFINEIKDDLDVFLYAKSAHGTQPAGWRRKQGLGKVTVLTPGQTKDIWLSFNNRSMIENVIDWLVKVKVTT